MRQKPHKVILIATLAILIIAAAMLPALTPAAMALTYPDNHGGMIRNTIMKPNGLQGGFRAWGPLSHANLKAFGMNGVVLQEWTDINIAEGSFDERWLDPQVDIAPGDYLLFVLTGGDGLVQSNVSTFVVEGSSDANQVSFQLQVLAPCRNLVTVFGDPKTTYSIPSLNYSKDLGTLTPGTSVEVTLPEGVGYLPGTAPDWVEIVLDGNDPNQQLLPRHLVEKVPGSWLECRKPATATWTPSPSVTPTSKPSDTPTAPPTALPSATPTGTPVPTATATMTPLPTATAQPQYGTVKISKIAIIPREEEPGGFIAVMAPGWPMTVTTASGEMVGTTQTGLDGTVTVTLPPGRYKVAETQFPDWVPELWKEVEFDLSAGKTVEVMFRNRELIESRQSLYLPVICGGQGQTTPTPPATECGLIHFQSGTRDPDTGISPGTDLSKALRFWVDGPYSRAVWKVIEVEGTHILYNENLPCSNGKCETGLIFGTPEKPQPRPNSMLLVTVQLIDLSGRPSAVCARVLWTDPPGDALTAASSADMLNQFFAAIRLLHELDQQ